MFTRNIVFAVAVITRNPQPYPLPDPITFYMTPLPPAWPPSPSTWPHHLLSDPITSYLTPSPPAWPHHLLPDPITCLTPSPPTWPHYLLPDPITFYLTSSPPAWPIISYQTSSPPSWPHDLLPDTITSFLISSLPTWLHLLTDDTDQDEMCFASCFGCLSFFFVCRWLIWSNHYILQCVL